jgi:hypothetical protein
VTVSLQVAGAGGVPAGGVSAVVLNVTVTAPSAASFVSVFPDGTARSSASNVNFAAGQTISDLVVTSSPHLPVMLARCSTKSDT